MKNFIILVMGVKGSGKSFYVKNKILPLLPSYIVIDVLDEYNGFSVRSFEELLDSVNKKKKIVCKFDDDLDTSFAFELIWEMGNTNLILEEIDIHADPRSIDPTLERIIKYGRHRNISMIGICRRPYELNTIFRSQADSVITFEQHELRDVEYLVKTFGAGSEDIQRLGKYEHITLREEPISLIKDLTSSRSKDILFNTDSTVDKRAFFMED